MFAKHCFAASIWKIYRKIQLWSLLQVKMLFRATCNEINPLVMNQLLYFTELQLFLSPWLISF